MSCNGYRVVITDDVKALQCDRCQAIELCKCADCLISPPIIHICVNVQLDRNTNVRCSFLNLTTVRAFSFQSSMLYCAKYSVYILQLLEQCKLLYGSKNKQRCSAAKADLKSKL